MFQQNLVDKFKTSQENDLGMVWLIEEIKEKGESGFSIFQDEVLMFRDRLCVPNDNDIKRTILEEAYRSPYIVYLGNTKIYCDMKKYFQWNGMKRKIVTPFNT